MSWKKYVIGGVLFFVIFMISNVPVLSVVSLAKIVSPASFSQLKLYGASGTLWQGEFDRVDVSGKSFQAVSWDINLLNLLTLQVSADVTLRMQGQPFSANINASPFGSIALENVKGSIGAQQLVQLANIPAVRLDGEFVLNLETVTISDQTLTEAVGRIVWTGAETRFPQRVLLGDLAADMTTEDDGIVVKISDAGGPLKMKADFLLDPENNYRLKGSMMAREGQQSLLGRSLGMMGSMDGQGNVKLDLKGNLSQFGFLIK